MTDFFNPQPKPDIVRLSPLKKTQLRRDLHKRAKGKCETCGSPAPLVYMGGFDLYKCGHISHKEHGSQKQDTLKGCLWECYDCHIGKKHSPKWTENPTF